MRVTIVCVAILAMVAIAMPFALADNPPAKVEASKPAGDSPLHIKIEFTIDTLEKQIKAQAAEIETLKKQVRTLRDPLQSKVSLVSPNSKQPMATLQVVNDTSAGLWLTGSKGKSQNTGAVVGYQDGPYLAVYDANRRTDGMAHQVALTVTQGRPTIQVALSVDDKGGQPPQVKFIDLYNLALFMEQAERKKK